MKRMLKKSLALILALTLVFGAAPLAGLVGLELPAFNLFGTKAEATTYNGTCGDNLTWTLDDETGVLTVNGTGAMTNYFNSSKAPWYNYRSSIKTVVIDDGVTNIGAYAFSICPNLSSITVPDSVTIIGDYAFESCVRLTSVTIPDSIISIGYCAFKDCTGLTNITIPNSVTTIGDYAFENCTSLTNITIPDSVTSIGDWAFCGCSGLTSVTIGNGVTRIGLDAFDNTGLYNDSTNWEDDVLYIGNFLIKAKTTISGDYSIKPGTKVIADYAFSDCKGLTNITIPDSVTSIGKYAFYYCTGLTSVTIPNSVTSIGESAFYECNGLTSVTIPDSVTRIGFAAFYNTGLYNDSTNWENNVLYIRNFLIDAKETISWDYVIKNGIKVIASDAFLNCTKLTSVTIPDSVTNIGWGAFYDCTSLTDVYYIGTEEEWNKISIDYGNSYLLNATIHFNSEPIPKSSVTSIVIADELPITSGNTLTFEVTTSTDITKLRIEDCGYVVNEWTGTEYYTDNDGVRTWTVTQIINTIGENRYLDFRAGNTEGYEENTYQSPVFTCIENEQKLPATTIEHPLSSGAFLQGDEQNLIWTVDGVPGDGTVPDYFIINVFKDNKLVFAERNLTAVDYLGNDGKFFYNLDGGYFEETGEYKISVTSVKEGYQYSDDEVVVSIYPPDLYIEGFNSEIEMVNVGENYYFSGKIKGANENISVVIQTPSESSNHEYFSQTKVVQEFDLSTLYPITFGSGKYSEPGEYYIKIFARSLGKGEDTLLAQKRIVLLEDGVQQLDKPVITSGVVTKIGESYKITWDAVDNADYYTVIVSELGVRQTGIETESFELSDKTFKSAGEYTILVYAHSYSDEYVTSNNSIKLTVTKQDVGCSVLSARIIGDTTIKAGYFLNFEVVTTQDATKLRLMDKNYVVTEWTDSSSYVDKDGKRYWTIKEMMKTVGVNRKLQFAAGNSQGYSDVKAEVTFTCNENPNKLGNIKITSPVDGCSYDQNNLQYLVWNYDSEILPDYYIVEVFTNSQTKKYLNKNVAGNLLWIEIPAEYFENTGTYTISITAVKEFYQPSSANVTFLSKCTHLHTEMSDPVMIKGSYKILNDTQHSYQTQAVETCINCGVQVNKIVETKTENHNMHEGLLCACGQYKTQSGFKVIDGLYLQSNKSEYTYLDASTTLGYWGSVSPSDSGYISMLGKVTRNGKEYAFIRYPLNGGGYKCGFIRSELIGIIPFNQPFATVNGEKVDIVYDSNGYLYADAEQLFTAIGGKASVRTHYSSDGKFEGNVAFFHNSYEYGAYETGYLTSYFRSTTNINWISSGDKYVIENGRYYDIEYYLEGNNLDTKRVLGGTQKLYTANNKVYFPISVLTSDLCRYDEVSALTYTYNYNWYTSDDITIESNNYANDYFDVLYTNKEAVYRVVAKKDYVNFTCGKNIFAESKGVSCNVFYDSNNNNVSVIPTEVGAGTIIIYHYQNGKKTIIFSKSIHCFDSSIIRGSFNYGTNETESDKVYTFADGLQVTNLKVDNTEKGVNVSFDAYNSNVNCFVVQSHDKYGNDLNTFNLYEEQVGFNVIKGFYLEGGATTGAVQGAIKTINVFADKKHKIENSYNEYQHTHVSVWVPIDGYLTIDDSRNSDIALVYDTLMVGYAENNTVCTAIDFVFSQKLSEIDYSKNCIVDYIVGGSVNAGASALLLDELRTDMCGSTEDSMGTVKTFLESFVIGPLSDLSPFSGMGDIASKMLCEWSNVHFLTKSLERNAQKASICYQDFGVTNIYFKPSSKYRMLRTSINNKECLNSQTAILDNYLNGYTQGFANGKYGLCDIYGNYVIAPEWNRVSDYNCGIVSVMDDYGCKFLDITGRVIFESNHQYAGTFYNNRCIVMNNEYCFGVIDNNGIQIVPCAFDCVWILHDSYVLAMKDNSYSIVDPEGKTLFTFDEEFVGLSSDRKVIVTKDENGLVGAVGYTGEIIAKNKFDGTGGVNGNAVAMEKDGMYTVFDLNGKKLFEIAADYVGEFSKGVATVKDDNGVRLINLSGDTVADMPDDVTDVCPFKDGHAVVYYSDGSYAYMNNQYQIVTDKYSFASDFKDGYAVVSVTENESETWMLIDESFNAVNVFDGDLEFRQDDFNSGYVFSSIENGETGYITVGDMKEQNEQLSFEKLQTCLREEGTEKLNVFFRNGDSSLVWESSNPSVATVDSSGNVVALSVGETIITVSSDKGNTSECVVKVLPNKYKLTWIVDGNKTEQVIKIGNTINVPATPTKPGYKFAGWTPEVPETMPSEDITFFAVFECVSGISIKNNPGSKTISYGETLRLTAVATDIPENAKIEWYVDGVKKGEGETFEVSPKNGSVEITVKIVDSNGNVLKDKNGNEIQDSEKVSVNSGLWQKIVSFFKNLFGINRTVVQAIFKGIF